MTRQLLLLALLAAAPAAWSAEQCAVEIHGTDQMTFENAAFTVPKSCT